MRSGFLRKLTTGHWPLTTALLLSACPPPPKEPAPPPGPFLVLFAPWPVSQDGKLPAPARTAFQVGGIAKEIFKDALFEEEALKQAERAAPCVDLPCAADVARKLNAKWVLTGEVRAFPPEHCFAFFSARSFETGAEILGYNPEQVDQSSVSSDKAAFALRGEKLKRCDDPAFLEEVRGILRKMAEDLRTSDKVTLP
jgi:hypothetical protein